LKRASSKPTPKHRLFPYTDDSIRKIIKVAKRKARLDATIHPIHGLRSYFEAQLIAAGTHPSYIKMLHGRFDDPDAKHYTPRDIETLRPEYEHAYPHLDFLNNAPQHTQELSTKQTELQDLINEQNQRIQRLEELIRRKQEADTEIMAILQSPRALRRTAAVAEYVLSKNIPDIAIKALEATGLPCTPENITIAIRAYYETHPQDTQEFARLHPEFRDPTENAKALPELKRSLATPIPPISRLPSAE
jgi:predicted ribosome quality control (RQC) complex YloA/Tae2 family protein